MKITARMKWIVKTLKDHPEAVISHERDEFVGKDYYWLEWGNGKDVPYEVHPVTKAMRKKLAEAKMIVIVNHREVRSKLGTFVTTERDWGLPEGQSTTNDDRKQDNQT